jgi:hypothetical protein
VCPTPVDWINDHLTPVIDEVILAVLSTCCDFSHTRESVFSTKCKQSYVYHTGNHKRPNIQLVDVNAIVRHCLMVPHENGHSSYHEIWSQELMAVKSSKSINTFGAFGDFSTFEAFASCLLLLLPGLILYLSFLK